MPRKEDKYLEVATAYARSCGYKEKLEYSHTVNSCHTYKLIPIKDEGLTGYPMIVKVFTNGKTTIDIDDDYKFRE